MVHSEIILEELQINNLQHNTLLKNILENIKRINGILNNPIICLYHNLSLFIFLET